MSYRLPALVVLCLTPLAFLIGQLGFNDSLHATRAGKGYFYSQANGGFETLTGIPMSELACTNCHAATKADGTPIEDATYQPGCDDCHNFATGTGVPDNVCRGCHGRQNTEINLSGNPALAAMFSDVHRDAGMACTDCHDKDEFPVEHSVSTTVFQSMLEAGASHADCETCHPKSGLLANQEHTTHYDYVECNACHSKTVIACYNCHFETELAQKKKRFYGAPPLNGFALLVNDAETGKVTTATLQAVTYNDQSFYTVAPFHGHTVGRDVRACTDCHDTEVTRTYNTTGEIPVVQWDGTRLNNTKGLIPVPENWQTALKFDFVRFKGDANDPITPLDPTQWEFMKSGADLTQMLFATPLTDAQMAKLSANVVSTEEAPAVPHTYALSQNYPNPFNPQTTISYTVPKTGAVTLTVVDASGRVVATLFDGVRSPGTYSATWEGSGAASGIYFYRLEAEGFAETKGMVVLK